MRGQKKRRINMFLIAYLFLVRAFIIASPQKRYEIVVFEVNLKFNMRKIK